VPSARQARGVVVGFGPAKVENLNHRRLHVPGYEAFTVVDQQTSQLAKRLDVVLVDYVKRRGGADVLETKGGG
jgi:hypothetical protein